MTNKLKVGFIGTGLMGHPMSKRLLEHGFELSVWNRTREKYSDLVEAGAKAMNTPRAVAEASDVVCLCLLDGKAVEEIVFGESGVVAGIKPGQILIDFSTIGVKATQRLATRLKEEAQGKWIDAPVSGGSAGARNGTLVVFAGGDDEETIDNAAPIFDVVGSKVTHLGPVGSGQVAKICNQIIVGCNLMLIAEMIATARKTGLNVNRLHEAMAGSWSDSLPLQIFAPRMAARVSEPKLGAIGTMLKDLYEAIDLAHSFGASVPITSLMAEQYSVCSKHVKSGLEADVSSLICLYESDL